MTRDVKLSFENIEEFYFNLEVFINVGLVEENKIITCWLSCLIFFLCKKTSEVEPCKLCES